MKKFYDGLAEIFEIDAAQISPQLELSKTSWDSMARVAVISLIDECYNLVVEARLLRQCQTVGDIEKLVAEASKGAA